ncbi:MAG: YciI family protein [Cyclobacteriaceae bacterium]
MNEFVLLIQGDGVLNFTKQEIESRQKKYITWMNDLLERGQYVWGQPLKPTGIHLKDKDNLLSDGPFLEPKEMIGGIVIFKAVDMEEAEKIAHSCPLLSEFEIFLRPASMEM